MDNKIHQKLYKSGKKWCCAMIIAAAIALTMTTTTAYADIAPNTPNETQTSDAEATKLFNMSNQNLMVADQTETTQSINAREQDDNINYGYLDQSQITFDQNNGTAGLHFSGWHVDGQSDELKYRYAILYDNTANEELHRERIEPIERPDVQKVYPDVANSDKSGFEADFIWPNNIAGHKLSLVTRYSDDPINGENGQKNDYWFAPIVIDKSNVAYLDSISNDGSGLLTISGWHATNQAFGCQYHYVIAFDKTTG